MSLFTAAATSKLAAAALGLLTVGGVGTAAATGSLPAPAQDLAHQLAGAPAPVVKDVKNTVSQTAAQAEKTAQDKAASAKDAVKKAVSDADAKASSLAGKAAGAADQAVSGAGATDVELLGLCKADASNTLDASSTGFKTLVLAAHGESNVATFCANLAGQQVSVQGSANGDGSAQVNAPALPQLPAVPGKVSLPSLPSVPAVNAPELPKVAG